MPLTGSGAQPAEWASRRKWGTVLPVFATALFPGHKGGLEVGLGWAPVRSSSIRLLLVGGCPFPMSSPSHPPTCWPQASSPALGPQAGSVWLRSPHSPSCFGCGSLGWGFGRGCVCGFGSDCDCCSFRGCGPGWGCGWGSGWSSHCSGSWRKRRGWAGSKEWDAFGHCGEEKWVTAQPGP